MVAGQTKKVISLESLLMLGIGLVAALTVLALIKRSLFVVQQGTAAVIKRWGKHHRVLMPGLHFRLIFADALHRTFSSRRQSLTLTLSGDSGGRLPVEVSADVEVRGLTEAQVIAVLAYEVEEPLRHLSVVADSAARETLLGYTYADLLANAPAFAEALKARLQDVARDCGFEILNVRITRIRPEASVQAAIVEGERAQALMNTRLADATGQKEIAAAEAETAAVRALAERKGVDESVAQFEAGVEKLKQAGIDPLVAAHTVERIMYWSALSRIGEGTHLTLTVPDAVPHRSV